MPPAEVARNMRLAFSIAMDQGMHTRVDARGLIKLATPRRAVHKALLTALLYLLLGLLWIQWSDYWVNLLAPDPAMAAQLQTWKGWFFVIATAALLFVVLHRLLHKDATLLQQQHGQQEVLHELNQFRESIIDNANVWINVLDAQARIMVWNKAAERISGYRREDVVGRADIWAQLYPDPGYRAEIAARVRKILDDGLEVEGFETRMCCRDGSYKIMSWNQKRFFDSNEEVGSIAIGQDVTERNRLQQELERMAVHDPLTGLFNRRKFELLVEEQLARCVGEQLFAMLWIDIDGFKGVNDRYGHQVGDEVLRGVGGLMQNLVGERGIAARYGGDELVIVLPNTSEEAACVLGEQLRGRVQEARLLAAHAPKEPLTVSIGVAAMPAQTTTLGELAVAADQAMYRAKTSGRNRVRT